MFHEKGYGEPLAHDVDALGRLTAKSVGVVVHHPDSRDSGTYTAAHEPTKIVIRRAREQAGDKASSAQVYDVKPPKVPSHLTKADSIEVRTRSAVERKGDVWLCDSSRQISPSHRRIY